MKKYLNFPFYLSIIWLICIILVNPIGDFPLNDDWSYGRNAKALALENKIYFDDWGAMTLIVHTMWGAFFCKIFGFSFTVLRFSTLLLGWAALLMTNLFFQEGGMNKKQAGWATLLLAFNPFFFTNAFTYMTEVPFMFFFITSSYFALKSINNKSDYNIIFTTLFSILAVLIRQHAVLVPLAFFFVFIIKNKLSLKTVIQSVIPFFLTFSTLNIFTNWRNSHYGLSENFGSTNTLYESIFNGRLELALQYKAQGFFTYWGLFLLPILILLIPYFLKRIPRIWMLVSIILTLIICYPYFSSQRDFLGNTFNNLGVGYIGITTSSQDSPPQIGLNDWENIFLIALIAATFLVQWILIRTGQIFILIKNKDSNQVNWSTPFALIICFTYFCFLMLNNHYIDRYNLLAVPFLILLIAPFQQPFHLPKAFKVLSQISFLIIVFFSIGATHDYLSWNRARWEASDFAHDNYEVKPGLINGGFEYKFTYGNHYMRPHGWEDMETWNTTPEQFLISFSEECKYETKNTFPYQRYFPPKTDTIFLLKKEPVTFFDTITCNMDSLSEEGEFFLTNQDDLLLANAETRNSEKSYSGNYAVAINSGQEYALTFTIKNIEPCEKISVTLNRFPARHPAKAVMVYDQKYYLKNLDYLTILDKSDWGKLNQEFKIPADFKEKTLTFFLFNPSAEKVYFDDLIIMRMK